MLGLWTATFCLKATSWQSTDIIVLKWFYHIVWPCSTCSTQLATVVLHIRKWYLPEKSPQLFQDLWVHVFHLTDASLEAQIYLSWSRFWQAVVPCFRIDPHQQSVWPLDHTGPWVFFFLVFSEPGLIKVKNNVKNNNITNNKSHVK